MDKRSTKNTVLLFGGSGGLTNRYREVVERRGLVMRHYENRVPAGARHVQGTVALVIVMVGMVSHALRDQAVNLAGEGAQVVYLRTGSISALRGAVDAFGQRAA